MENQRHSNIYSFFEAMDIYCGNTEKQEPRFIQDLDQIRKNIRKTPEDAELEKQLRSMKNVSEDLLNKRTTI